MTIDADHILQYIEVRQFFSTQNLMKKRLMFKNIEADIWKYLNYSKIIALKNENKKQKQDIINILPCYATKNALR